jgi:lipid-binding SYLF domain-containing protein
MLFVDHKKIGLGLAAADYGRGFLIARLGQDQWSAPVAIKVAGVSFGATLGYEHAQTLSFLQDGSDLKNFKEGSWGSKSGVTLTGDATLFAGGVDVHKSMPGADLGKKPGMGRERVNRSYSVASGAMVDLSLGQAVFYLDDTATRECYGRTIDSRELLTTPTPENFKVAHDIYGSIKRT